MKKQPLNDKQLPKIGEFIKDDARLIWLLAISGTVFNVGLVFIPVFEGWLVQCLYDIIGGRKVFYDMLKLVGVYLLVMFIVQTTRYMKRFYVRKIANNMVVRMRDSLYDSVVHMPTVELNGQVGELVTRAASDVEIVAEGTRKTLTEIFDTGVLLLSYGVTLFIYDPAIAAIAILFTPVACYIAEILKRLIFKQVSEYKLSAERLSNNVYDRVKNVMVYRIFGRDKDKNEEFDADLKDLEKKSVKANIWENTLQPIYNVITMTGVIFIIYLGGRNCLGVGYRLWDIAALTTTVACYVKISDKASKVARLVNSIQKAEVSWKRLRANLSEVKACKKVDETTRFEEKAVNIAVNGLKFTYPNGKEIIKNADFQARSGQIIGITGQIASGKTTLGKVFLCEYPYGGSVTVNGKELSEFTDGERCDCFTYLGHNPELFSFSVKENIAMGDETDVGKFLSVVDMDDEVAGMENGADTLSGNLGLRLSGGQQARVALARTLSHAGNVLILDDPFSAVDKKTELKVFENIKKKYSDRLIIIISHRLTLFPLFDKVLWLEDGIVTESTHSGLYETNPEYRGLYDLQREVCNE